MTQCGRRQETSYRDLVQGSCQDTSCGGLVKRHCIEICCRDLANRSLTENRNLAKRPLLGSLYRELLYRELAKRPLIAKGSLTEILPTVFSRDPES